jgi:hypothetical protein
MLAMMARAHVGRLAVLCMLCCILTGCGKSKVTKDNFDQIKNDMSLEDVEHLLGQGTELTGDPSLMAAQAGVNLGGEGSTTSVHKWESGKKSITISFRKGKVFHKASEGL